MAKNSGVLAERMALLNEALAALVRLAAPEAVGSEAFQTDEDRDEAGQASVAVAAWFIARTRAALECDDGSIETTSTTQCNRDAMADAAMPAPGLTQEQASEAMTPELADALTSLDPPVTEEEWIAFVEGDGGAAWDEFMSGIETEELGDRIMVVAYARDGSPVRAHFRRRPRSGDGLGGMLSNENTVVFGVEGQSPSGSRSMTEMKFGSHAEAPPRNMLTGVTFPTLVRLNERTDDGRLIRSGGFNIRDLPLSFSAMFTTMHGAGEAVIVGSLDEVTIEDDGRVWGRGWLMDTPEGRRAGVLVQAGALRGNSIELAVKDYDVQIDWERMKIELDFLESKLSATTLVANPAMEGCTVELEDPDFDFGTPETAEALVAAFSTSAASTSNNLGLGQWVSDSTTLPALPVPAMTFSTQLKVREADPDDDQPLAYEVTEPAPSAAWFGEEDWMEELTPIRIDEPDADGFRHVWGYLFDWETPHLGLLEQGIVLRAPHSRTDYAYFANGEVLVDDGTFVAVGRLHLGCKHADERVDWQRAQQHYDDSGRAWAAVAIGENHLGGWVNGYVLPGTSDSDVAVARALGTSGDWRRIGGSLELVAGLTVAAEGFPKPRPTAYSHGGLQRSLLSAGYIEPNWQAQRALGRFISDAQWEDVHAAAAFVQRVEMEGIESALSLRQREEMAAIAEGLRR